MMNKDQEQLYKSNNSIDGSAKNHADSRQIIVLDSFEEFEDTQIEYWAQLNPEQRFACFHELMNRFFTFTKPDWSKSKIIRDL